MSFITCILLLSTYILSSDAIFRSEYSLPTTPFTFDLLTSLDHNVFLHSKWITNVTCVNCTFQYNNDTNTQVIYNVSLASNTTSTLLVYVPWLQQQALLTIYGDAISMMDVNNDFEAVAIQIKGPETREYNISMPADSWTYNDGTSMMRTDSVINTTANLTSTNETFELTGLLKTVPLNEDFNNYTLVTGLDFVIVDAIKGCDEMYILGDLARTKSEINHGGTAGWEHVVSEGRMGIGVDDPRKVSIRSCLLDDIRMRNNAKTLTVMWYFVFVLSGQFLVRSTGMYFKSAFQDLSVKYLDAIEACRVTSTMIRRVLATVTNEEEADVVNISVQRSAWRTAPPTRPCWICARGYGTVESFRWECGVNQGQPLFYSRWA
eukprot:PhF_6_TR10012/c0_g1_i1/m.15293